MIRRGTEADLETLVAFTLEEAREAEGLAADPAARASGALDLRLYAHAANARALRAYRRCGFVNAPYVVMRLGDQ